MDRAPSCTCRKYATAPGSAHAFPVPCCRCKCACACMHHWIARDPLVGEREMPCGAGTLPPACSVWSNDPKCGARQRRHPGGLVCAAIKPARSRAPTNRSTPPAIRASAAALERRCCPPPVAACERTRRALDGAGVANLTCVRKWAAAPLRAGCFPRDFLRLVRRARLSCILVRARDSLVPEGLVSIGVSCTICSAAKNK